MHDSSPFDEVELLRVRPLDDRLSPVEALLRLFRFCPGDPRQLLGQPDRLKRMIGWRAEDGDVEELIKVGGSKSRTALPLFCRTCSFLWRRRRKSPRPNSGRDCATTATLAPCSTPASDLAGASPTHLSPTSPHPQHGYHPETIDNNFINSITNEKQPMHGRRVGAAVQFRRRTKLCSTRRCVGVSPKRTPSFSASCSSGASA